ncbi:hypothetical protein C4J81_17280 [Deltaproteobacteria bacterium Smac51]|nr:hypothetical protein C4J81_17280 [Deltaproteobacteria bacterium Smac51]
MTAWLKDIAKWEIGRTLYLSVPFTWLLPKARQLALLHKGPVQAGGPAVQLMPDYLADVAAVNRPCPVEPLLFHNPLATFTSRGCPNSCPFCAVPRIEGDLVELGRDWRPAPIICDNNLLAASRRHFGQVIGKLKDCDFPFVDFNQGLEARLLTPFHIYGLTMLKNPMIRFAFDHVNDEAAVADAISLCRKQGLKDFGVYVLIGFNDTPEDAQYRLEKVWEWGALPNPMRYQPLDSLEKNQYVQAGWTDTLLKDYMRCYSNSKRFGQLSIINYNPGRHDLPLLEGLVAAE